MKVPQNEHYGNMMARMLETNWPGDESTDSLLHFVATFKPLTVYFKGFCKYFR